MYDYAKYDIPEYMWAGFDNYFKNKYRPGSFLYAVLTNDLYTAATLSDAVNINLIKNYVLFLLNEAPHTQYGSIEIVEKWLA